MDYTAAFEILAISTGAGFGVFCIFSLLGYGLYKALKLLDL